MRKIISMLLAVSLLATLFAGVSAFAADYDDLYVYKMSEVSRYHALNDIDGDPIISDDGSYVTYPSTANAGDAYVMIPVDSVPIDEYGVFAVRYKADSLHGNGNFLNDGQNFYGASNGMTADGEWHLQTYVIDGLFSNAATKEPLTTDTPIKYARVVGAKAGGSISIAYIGFFKSEAEAQAYDAAYAGGATQDPGQTNPNPSNPNPSDPNPTTGDNNASVLFALAAMFVVSATTFVVLNKKRAYKG